MKALHAIHHLNDKVGRWISVLTLIMVLIGSGNSIARYLGKFFGTQLTSNLFLELQWYLFALLFLLAAPRTLQQDKHVRVDIFYGRLSPKGKAWLDLAGTLFFLLPFCALMIWSSFPTVMHSWEVMEMSPDPGGLPRYPLKTALPIAFLLLFLQGICLIASRIDILRGHGDEA